MKNNMDKIIYKSYFKQLSNDQINILLGFQMKKRHNSTLSIVKQCLN